MKRLFKSVVRPLLHRMGYDFVKYRPIEDLPIPDLLTVRQKWMQRSNLSLVLDVGANEGQYARHIRSEGYAGRIISFEPLRAAFKQLQSNAAQERNWEALNVGLGRAPDTMKINVAGNSQSSSFLPMLPRHITAAPTTGYVAAEDVPVITLDSLSGERIQVDDVVWLKLDVQGYELNVLEGASKMLQQIVAIEAELSLAPLYEGGPLIDEVIRYLTAKGFCLSHILQEDAFVDPNTFQQLQVNGIFLKEKAAFSA
jgi:FkbM family methyltransferase